MNAEDFDLPESPDHESLEHVDERWLVSYSDMMTLLFGFFVLLYSMYDRFDVIQYSVEKKFGVDKPAAAEPARPVETPAAVETRKDAIDIQAKYLAAQTELEKTQAKLKSAEETIEVLKTPQEVVPNAALRIRELESERDELRRQLASREIESTLAASSSGAAGAAPAPEEPPRPPGRGEGHGGRGRFHVYVTFPDGSVFEEDTVHVGIYAMEISKRAQLLPRDRLKVQITRDGQTITATVKPLPLDKDASKTILKFQNMESWDQSVFDSWFDRH